jgi:cytochrome c
MQLRSVSAVLFLVSAALPTLAADEGAALFKKNCQTCHAIEKDAAARQGPPLYGVVGRQAGSIEGFKYSEGLKAAGWEWTPEKLDEWLAFPKKMIRSTTMVYRQNDPAVRKTIVAYLAAQKD